MYQGMHEEVRAQSAYSPAICDPGLHYYYLCVYVCLCVSVMSVDPQVPLYARGQGKSADVGSPLSCRSQRLDSGRQVAAC